MLENNKYNELEKLNQLKENGIITENEFKIQKYNILNANTKTRNKTNIKISNVFLIMALIFIIITISCFLYKNWCSKKYNTYMEEHIAEDIALKYGKITQSEYTSIENNKQKLRTLNDTTNKIFVISSATTIIILIIGVGLKIKEKGVIKIVD